MIDREIVLRLAAELKLDSKHVMEALRLLEDGATIPFVARYRREVTGGLTDADLLSVTTAYKSCCRFKARLETISKEIREQGKLTTTLALALGQARSLADLEDLYRPYKPKRLTRGSKARQAGLEPLAALIVDGESYVPADYVQAESGWDSEEKVVRGAADIIAEDLSDQPALRSAIKKLMREKGQLASTLAEPKNDPRRKFQDYYQKSFPVSHLRTHSYLAMQRGQREEVLRLRYLLPDSEIEDLIYQSNFTADHPHRAFLEKVVADAYTRLILPSVTTDIDRELFAAAERESLDTFEKSLMDILMRPPYAADRILGFDPGFHHGCKLAVIDGTGKVLDTAVIYPTTTEKAGAAYLPSFVKLLQEQKIEVIALGNGTATRESEDFIIRALEEVPGVTYEVVSEDGASIYSVTKLAQEEFPQFDPNLRSAVSIARRLLDPLSELVKIDPSGLGVGQYQHDLDEKKLKERLEAVVQNAVNRVGVDVNTASVSLLTNISGLNRTLAQNIVDHIAKNGRLHCRQELLMIKGFGPKAFENAAGFLRISGDEAFDRTSVHPESYELARRFLKVQGLTYPQDRERLSVLREADFSRFGELLNATPSQLADLSEALLHPGRDPRGVAVRHVRDDKIRKIDDLIVGQVLEGIVSNITDFGIFVDLGVHVSGLVHVSNIASRYVGKEEIRSYASIGKIVKVKVISVDIERQRIGLSMNLSADSVK